jgi:hypothetical protein
VARDLLEMRKEASELISDLHLQASKLMGWQGKATARVAASHAADQHNARREPEKNSLCALD